MPVNSVAENVLGTMGAVCWMIQLLPQVWKSWKEKSTKGLSHYLPLMWCISGAFLGTYNIVQNLNVPLIVQPQILSSLSLLSWTQCQHYDNKRTTSVCVALFAAVVCVLGGFEAGMVFAIRPAYRSGNHRPTQFFGIMSSILLSSALFPQYYEIYKYREVIGISVAFMFIDMMGGVFSLLSLGFKPKFDVIAGVAYGAVVLLDGIVILLALILNPIARKRRQREEEAETEKRALDEREAELRALEEEQREKEQEEQQQQQRQQRESAAISTGISRAADSRTEEGLTNRVFTCRTLHTLVPTFL